MKKDIQGIRTNTFKATTYPLGCASNTLMPSKDFMTARATEPEPSTCRDGSKIKIGQQNSIVNGHENENKRKGTRKLETLAPSNKTNLSNTNKESKKKIDTKQHK